MDVEPFKGKALDALAHNYAITAYEGAVRSGKTIVSLIDWLRFCRNGPDGLFLMTGRTERTVINNLIMPLVDMLGSDRVKINRGNGTVDICGRQVLIVGANNEAARTKIQGLSLAGAYADEAATLPESYFNMLFSRLSVPGARIWITSNPEGPFHWLKTEWLDKASLWIDRDGEHHPPEDPEKALDLLRVSFKLEDNEFLVNNNPEYIERVKKSYSGLWKRRFLLGEWVVAEGTVYDMWDPAKHVVKWEDMPRMQYILGAGVDVGTTNPTVCLILARGEDDNLYFIDEWRYAAGDGTQKLSDQKLAERMHHWLHNEPHYPGAQPGWTEPLIVDPAAASFRYAMKDLRQGTVKAVNDKKRGIKTFGNLLAAERLFVSDRCHGLISEMPLYSWDPKATERGEDEPIKKFDHSLDAGKYSLSSLEKRWRKFIDINAMSEPSNRAIDVEETDPIFSKRLA